MHFGTHLQLVRSLEAMGGGLVWPPAPIHRSVPSPVHLHQHPPPPASRTKPTLIFSQKEIVSFKNREWNLHVLLFTTLTHCRYCTTAYENSAPPSPPKLHCAPRFNQPPPSRFETFYTNHRCLALSDCLLIWTILNPFNKATIKHSIHIHQAIVTDLRQYK